MTSFKRFVSSNNFYYSINFRVVDITNERSVSLEFPGTSYSVHQALNSHLVLRFSDLCRTCNLFFYPSVLCLQWASFDFCVLLFLLYSLLLWLCNCIARQQRPATSTARFLALFFPYRGARAHITKTHMHCLAFLHCELAS